jgi:hypothetical protein
MDTPLNLRGFCHGLPFHPTHPTLTLKICLKKVKYDTKQLTEVVLAECRMAERSYTECRMILHEPVLACNPRGCPLGSAPPLMSWLVSCFEKLGESV